MDYGQDGRRDLFQKRDLNLKLPEKDMPPENDPKGKLRRQHSLTGFETVQAPSLCRQADANGKLCLNRS